MTDIKSMNMEELKELMVQIGEKPFRAKQIYGWLHEHLVTSYDEMANIPKSSEGKTERLSYYSPGRAGCTDFKSRRNQKVSVPSFGWKYD